MEDKDGFVCKKSIIKTFCANLEFNDDIQT